MKPPPWASDRFPVFVAAFLAIAAAGTKADPIRLRPGVPVELPAAAPEPVRKAAEDLRRDLRAQLGADSPLLSAAPPDGEAIRIVVHDPNLAGPEAYRITVEHAAAEAPRVTLAGSDERGAIYAIYAFSEKILGVPPLWYFAQRAPSRLASGDPDRARALRAADSALARMRSRLACADAVPFSGWSDSEHLWGIATKRERIAELLSPSQPGSSTTRVQDPLTP